MNGRVESTEGTLMNRREMIFLFGLIALGTSAVLRNTAIGTILNRLSPMDSRMADAERRIT